MVGYICWMGSGRMRFVCVCASRYRLTAYGGQKMFRAVWHMPDINRWASARLPGVANAKEAARFVSLQRKTTATDPVVSSFSKVSNHGGILPDGMAGP